VINQAFPSADSAKNKIRTGLGLRNRLDNGGLDISSKAAIDIEMSISKFLLSNSMFCYLHIHVPKLKEGI
jgi:hypothetical protein